MHKRRNAEMGRSVEVTFRHFGISIGETRDGSHGLIVREVNSWNRRKEQKVRKRNRAGRPPGPAIGRGARPWDPTRLGVEDQLILDFVAANPDMPRWLVAEKFAISPAR